MLTPSEESLEVAWFPLVKAASTMENPLYEKRMQNMVSHSSNAFCFAFTKRPFEIIIDDELKVGL